MNGINNVFGEHISFKDDDTIQLGPYNQYRCGSAFLSNVIGVENGIFVQSWTFKIIINVCDEMVFGIWRADASKSAITLKETRFFSTAIVLVLWRRIKVHHEHI